MISTLGREIRRIELEDCVLREVEHQAGAVLPPHAHTHVGLSIVLEGGFEEQGQGFEILLGPWQLLLRPADCVHSDRVGDDGCRMLAVDIGPGLERRLSGMFSGLEQHRCVDGAAVAGSAKRLHAEFRSGGIFQETAIEGLLLELLAVAARREHGASDHPEPHWMTSARGIIQEEFRRNLGLSELAERVGVHPVHLARAFREQHGMTVGDCIRRSRIDFASSELSGTQRPLSEIARRAGFADQSHFCRLFRRHTGMTPSQFRKSSRTQEATSNGVERNNLPEPKSPESVTRNDTASSPFSNGSRDTGRLAEES